MAQRSKAALVVLIIGLIVLALAPIWKWGIGPSLLKVPDTIDVTSVYDGTLTLYIDPAALAPLPPELTVRIPLTITRRDLSQPSKSTGSVAVIQETTKAIGPAGKAFVDTKMYYALGRKTSENVSNSAADFNRTGFYPIMPIGVKKQTYKLWSDDARRTGDAKFVKTLQITGLKTPSTPIYEFSATGPPVPTVTPPLGLPASVSGAQIKSILNNPAFAVVDTEQYPITYLKQTTATLWVEPRTGSIVGVPSNTDTYFVDASALGQPNIKLASIHYAQTSENIKNVLDETAKNWSLLDMVGLWIPLALLILGVILTVIGAVWLSRKKEPKAPAA